jgi:hypothetical protein
LAANRRLCSKLGVNEGAGKRDDPADDPDTDERGIDVSGNPGRVDEDSEPMMPPMTSMVASKRPAAVRGRRI